MTLREMKEQIYRLIEELSEDTRIKLTDDPDYEKKINTCINIVLNELARIKKIPAKMVYNTEESGSELEFTDDMYQVFKIIGCDYRIIGNTIYFDKDYLGDVTIHYYKYPTLIAEDDYDDEYEFELSQDALEIMPFGVAGDMLKSDPSTNYGAYYSSRYNELKQMLDSRVTDGIIYIDASEALDI